MAIAACQASHAQGVGAAEEANAITAELLKHARDLQREVEGPTETPLDLRDRIETPIGF